jgi:hypothetical protein
VTQRLLRWFPFVLLATGVAVVASRASRGASDNDLWWHLRLGYDFLEQGSLATPAHWSSLATQSWLSTEPLPEVIIAKADQWGGLDAVMWLYGVALMALVVALYAGNRVVSRPLPASLTALVALLGCATSLTPRPQLGSFVLLALVLRAWNRTSDDLQPRWYLIPLCYGWSLWHGFWFIGVAYGFLEIAGLLLDRRVRMAQAWPLLTVATLSGASVLLNPLGLGLFSAPFERQPARVAISEWGHTTPTTPGSITVLVMVLLVAGLLLTDRRLRSWRALLLFVTAVFWAWYAWRTLALASIVLSPLLARGLDAMLERSAPPGRESTETEVAPRTEVRVLTAWLAFCAIVLAALLPTTAREPSRTSAVDQALDTLPPGSVVLNYYDVGGWLAWRHPDLNRAIDGTVRPYDPSYVARYRDAMDVQPGWQAFIHDIDARAALLLDSSDIERALQKANWSVTARVDDYVLLLPPGAATAGAG